MTDAELRDRLLSHFYEFRDKNGGYVPVSSMMFSGLEPISDDFIAGVCRRLADDGLIEWTAYLQGATIGSARIRGAGVRAVERGKSASFEIQFPNKPLPVARDHEIENGPMSADKLRGGTGPLSPWQGPLSPSDAGVLSSVGQTSPLEPLAAREVPGESTRAALSAPTTDSVSQREILTLKPSFMGMSIDLKEFWRRIVAWRKARP